MKLSEILKGLKDHQIINFSEREIHGISYDTRSLKAGQIFVAISGNTQDGHLFVHEAVQKGCGAVVVQKKLNHLSTEIPQIVVPDSRRALSDISNNFYDYPSKKMYVVGITGTNGKTTTAHLLQAIIRASGHECAMLGTINYVIGKRKIPSWLTTPEISHVNELLAEAYSIGIRHAVMEVSSHSLAQGRVQGISFSGAIFTNLTQDHLDYHRTLEAYREAKLLLFKMVPKDGWASLNSDDPNYDTFRNATVAKIISYGLKSQDAQVTAEVKEMCLKGSEFILRTPQGKINVNMKLLCEYNIMNALACAAAASMMGIGLTAIKNGIESVTSIPGRLERVDEGQDFHIFVDFAHTEEALRAVMSDLRKLSTGRLIVVFGCGGDRDKTKRPKMGRVVEILADGAVLTSDNPRSEDPNAIIRDVLEGIHDRSKFIIQPDRRTAIHDAISLAESGDTVLIAGKGHETYQIIGKTVIPFDDREVAREVLAARGFRKAEKPHSPSN